MSTCNVFNSTVYLAMNPVVDLYSFEPFSFQSFRKYSWHFKHEDHKTNKEAYASMVWIKTQMRAIKVKEYNLFYGTASDNPRCILITPPAKSRPHTQDFYYRQRQGAILVVNGPLCLKQRQVESCDGHRVSREITRMSQRWMTDSL